MIDRLSKKVVKREMNIKPQDKTIKELLLLVVNLLFQDFRESILGTKKIIKNF